MRLFNLTFNPLESIVSLHESMISSKGDINLFIAEFLIRIGKETENLEYINYGNKA